MEYIKKNLGLIFVFLISLLPLVNLLTPGLPITHDGVNHAARIASFYTSISEGNIIPRWAGNLNWGFGHPILMFLYPLPSYFASFFHFIGFSFVVSLKITFAFSYSLSGIFMYSWLRKFLGNSVAVLGATLYLFAPYRFIDLYVRGALGEHVAFAFLPLVLFFLYKLNNLQKNSRLRNLYFNFISVSLSFAFLILSHNAISLLFIPFVLFYIAYLYFEKKSKNNLVLNAMALLYGFLLSFFFWLPAFIEGKYTLRDIVTAGAYIDRFIHLKNLLYGPWSFGISGEFSVQIGIAALILIVSSAVFSPKLFKNTDKLKYLFIGAFIFLLSSVFLMLTQSSLIWEKITIIQKLQFPWRFLAIIVFSSSLIGAIFIDRLNLKYKNLIVLILIILAIIPTVNYWQAREYKVFNDSYFEKKYNSTTDTGESSPIWSVRSMDKFPNEEIEVIEGEAEIVKLPGNSTYHEYVIVNDDKIRIRENTLYFPGWKIYDNYKELNNIEFQDPKNRGLITFYLEEGMHNIILKFEDTRLRRATELISLISIIILLAFPIIFLISPKLKIKNNKW